MKSDGGIYKTKDKDGNPVEKKFDAALSIDEILYREGNIQLAKLNSLLRMLQDGAIENVG